MTPEQILALSASFPDKVSMLAEDVMSCPCKTQAIGWMDECDDCRTRLETIRNTRMSTRQNLPALMRVLSEEDKAYNARVRKSPQKVVSNGMLDKLDRNLLRKAKAKRISKLRHARDARC